MYGFVLCKRFNDPDAPLDAWDLKPSQNV